MLGGMAQPDPWLEHYGERRRRPRRPAGCGSRSCSQRCARVAAGALGSLRAATAAGGRRAGSAGSHGCTHGGRVKAALRERAAGCTSPSSRPRGSRRAARSSTSRAGPAVRRPMQPSRSTRSSRRSASSATSCSSTSAERANRSASPVRRSTCGRPTPAPSRRTCAAASRICGEGPSGSRTASAAADLERVRRALGYGRIDVYGSSYGATLAQFYLRRFRGPVRTATLDGASLAGAPVYELAARNAERALRLLAPAALRSRPAGVRSRTRGADLAHALARAPAAAPTSSPRRSRCCCARPTTRRACRCSCTRPPPATPAARAGVRRSRGRRARRALAPAAVLGHDLRRVVGPLRRGGDGAREPRELPRPRRRGARESCSGRPARPCRASRARRERSWSSPVPVLLLAGDADPQDPPANVAGWRRAFPNGRLVSVPGLAHGVIAYGCLRLRRRALRRRRQRARPRRDVREPRAAASLRAQLTRWRARAARPRPACGRAPGFRGPRLRRGRRRSAATNSAARAPSTTAPGERVGAGAIEHEYRDGDAEHAAELAERAVGAGGLADVLGQRRSERRGGDVRQHQGDTEADRHERRDELGVARSDAHREGRAGRAGREQEQPGDDHRPVADAAAERARERARRRAAGASMAASRRRP